MRQHDERDDERGHSDHCPGTTSADRCRGSPFQPSNTANCESADDERDDDELRDPDRDADQREVRRQRTHRADADDVAQPESAGELAPRSRDAQQRQQRDADDEVETRSRRAARRASPSPLHPRGEVVPAGVLLDEPERHAERMRVDPDREHDVGLRRRVDLDRRQQIETAEDAAAVARSTPVANPPFVTAR